MTKFELSPSLLLQSIMGYLRRNNLTDTLSMLCLETNMTELSSTEELLYMNQLCLSGRWEDLLKYLQPLKDFIPSGEFSNIEFVIRRQQYLEALTWQSVADPSFTGLAPWHPLRHSSEMTTTEKEEMKVDMELVVQTLKVLEPLCSQREFNQLCNCLTYVSLSESPDYSNWTISKGRLECFEKLYFHFYPLFNQRQFTQPQTAKRDSHEVVYPRKGLEDMIAMGLDGFYQRFSDERSKSSREKIRVESVIKVHLHPSGLLLPEECEILPSHHPLLPVLITKTNELSEPSEPSEQSEPFEPTNKMKRNEHMPSHDEDLVGMRPSSLNQMATENDFPQKRGSQITQEKKFSHVVDDDGDAAASATATATAHHLPHPPSISSSIKPDDKTNVGNHSRVERRDSQEKDFPEERNKKVKGTTWNIEFDSPQETPHVRTGSESHRDRRVLNNQHSGDDHQDNNNSDLFPSSYHKPMKSNQNIERNERIAVDHDLPPPPIQNKSHQSSSSNHSNQRRVDPSERTHRQLHSDDHSLGSKSTTATAATAATAASRSKHSRVENVNNSHLPRWGQLPQGQCSLITPVCIHRDSAPLRCLSLLSPPLQSQHDLLEDSLGLHSQSPESSSSYSLIAVGSNSKSISLLNYDHTKPLTAGRVTIIDELNNIHHGSVYTLDWSSDCRYLASGSNDKYIRIISGQVPNGPFSVRSTLKGHNGTVRTVKFSPHPAILASGGGGDFKMRVWDVNQGTLLKEFTPHEDHIHTVEWVSDTLVLSGCERGQLICHDLRTTNPVWCLDLTEHDHHGGICSLFRNPGTDLAIIGHLNGGGFSLLDLRTCRILQTQQYHEADVRSVAMWSEISSQTSKNEIFALTTSFDGTGAVWQLRPSPGRGNPFELHQTARLVGHKDKILCCTHSKLTHDIFTSSADGTVLCWNPSEREQPSSSSAAIVPSVSSHSSSTRKK